MQLVKAAIRCLGCPFASTFSRECSVELRYYSSDSLKDTNKPKNPKKTKKKKLKKVDIEHTRAEPSFPFEGVESAKCHASSDIDIERVDSLNGVRHYVINSPEESYRFPSVTTVLDATQPPEMYFRLRNWRKGLVREHGEQGSINIAQGIIRSGKNFHKVPSLF